MLISFAISNVGRYVSPWRLAQKYVVVVVVCFSFFFHPFVVVKNPHSFGGFHRRTDA